MGGGVGWRDCMEYTEVRTTKVCGRTQNGNHNTSVQFGYLLGRSEAMNEEKLY